MKINIQSNIIKRFSFGKKKLSQLIINLTKQYNFYYNSYFKKQTINNVTQFKKILNNTI